MSEKIIETLNQRLKYLNILDQDLTKNEKLKEEEQQGINQLEETKSTVEHLTERPEWSTLIQLSKRIYVPGKIKHTGEYMVETKAHPSSYRALYTSKQTIDCLNRKIEEHRKNIMLLDNQRTQLTERQDLLTGKTFEDDIIDEETNDLPEEIVSDHGVAVKVGGFYEIIEYQS